MKLALATTLTLAALVLPACGSDDGYTAETRDNFVEACTAQQGATESYCGCAYDRISKTVPFDEFKRVDRDLGGDITKASKSVRDAFQKALEDCRKEL